MIDAADALAQVSAIGPYFTVGTGPVPDTWRPVQQLYTDTELLGGIITRVAARIGTTEPRVAASTFHLGFAARLWSIGLGALAGHGLLVDLDPVRLHYREVDGAITLHLPQPTCRQGDDLERLLVGAVLDGHLAPLAAALHRLQPVAHGLLWGNAASALLGAGRVLNRDELVRGLCADERLSGAVRFDTTGYRRLSCCLYYRVPGGGLCGDCALRDSTEAQNHSR